MGNNASQHQPGNGEASTSSTSNPTASGISLRDRSNSTTFTSSPIKAILSSHRDRSNSEALSSQILPSTPLGLIDGGHITPQGLYAIKGPTTWDYNQRVTRNYIIEKKLAPFYRGLDDYEEGWTDEQVVQALREVRSVQIQQGKSQRQEELENPKTNVAGSTSANQAQAGVSSQTVKDKEIKMKEDWPVGGVLVPITGKITELERKEAMAYVDAVECPICFLVSVRPSVHHDPIFFFPSSLFPSHSYLPYIYP